MRIMGLDVGTKTIGVAFSDATCLLAQPAGVVRRRSLREDVQALASMVRDRGVDHVVVGLPKNMDGSLGESAARSKRLAQALHAHCGVRVVMWDERLSTVAAERTLIEADVSRRRRKSLVDSVAAAMILQGYLDGRRSSAAERGSRADDHESGEYCRGEPGDARGAGTQAGARVPQDEGE